MADNKIPSVFVAYSRKPVGISRTQIEKLGQADNLDDALIILMSRVNTEQDHNGEYVYEYDIHEYVGEKGHHADSDFGFMANYTVEEVLAMQKVAQRKSLSEIDDEEEYDESTDPWSDWDELTGEQY